jgi:glycosyltransferase involved in cell wall biosynthesis
VWTVHPLVGGDPIDAFHAPTGRPVVTKLTDRHTVVESGTAYAPELGRWPTLNFALAQAALVHEIDRLIRREKVGIVRANEPFYLGLLGLLLARANGIPLVVRLIANYDSDFWAAGRPVHERLFRRRAIEKRVDRFVLRRADLVVAGNEDILRYALANGATEDRSVVVLVGSVIDPVHFAERTARPGVAAELGFGGRPFVICVTRLEEAKHPEDVVLVLAEARKRVPELAGVLVGDGSMRPQLEALVREHELQDHFVFAGNRDQEWIADALRAAAVVLSPLTGRALVEAALSGTVIVAYDVDWHSELVRHGETGVLVPYRDTHEMAEAVCDLLGDVQRAEQLGTAGRRLALEKMDPATLIAHERAAYRRLFRL